MSLELLKIWAGPGQPEAAFALVDRLIQERVGHLQFTVLMVDGAEVARLYSTDPAYPVGGRKPMGPTPWGEKVLVRQEVFLGCTEAELEWAFFDHAKIKALGLGCIMNVPVVYDGVTLGAISVGHRAGRYGSEHVAPVAELVPLLVPAFLEARRLLR